MNFTGSIIYESESLPDYRWTWLIITGVIMWVFEFNYMIGNTIGALIGGIVGLVVLKIKENMES